MMEPTSAYTPSPTRYDAMTYNRCGSSGLKLPAISLGCWHNFGDHTPFETMRQLTRTAFDHGITHFDLANNYGPEPGSAERNDNLKALENTEFTDRELSVIKFISLACFQHPQVPPHYPHGNGGRWPGTRFKRVTGGVQMTPSVLRLSPALFTTWFRARRSMNEHAARHQLRISS